MLLWCVGLMKATKEQGQALLLVDVGLTTMTQQQWQNDDSKQNEDLCVLENAKGTVLTPNIQGGLVLMLPCHAVISYDGDSSLSLKLQNQREIEIVLLGILYLKEYRSDWALVNEGGCLPPICSLHGSVWMREMVDVLPIRSQWWCCTLDAVHVGAAKNMRSMLELQSKNMWSMMEPQC